MPSMAKVGLGGESQNSNAGHGPDGAVCPAKGLTRGPTARDLRTEVDEGNVSRM